MGKNKTEIQIAELIAPAIESLQIELVDVEINRNGKSTELTVYIDKPGGVFLEDCETVSRLIDPMIEEADPIEEAYVLCVSSPGLDRPLKTEKDFERNIGKTVDVKLYKPFMGKKQFTGQLASYDETSFTVMIDMDTELVFTYEEVALVRLHVDFH